MNTAPRTMGISAAVMISTGLVSLVSGISVVADDEEIPNQRGIQVDKPSAITITVLYNNISHDPRLTTAWGMSCLIEGMEKTILFDTGGDGRILLSNMKKLGKAPKPVDVVVLSHIHGDHVGGIWEFLKQKSNVEVYMPKSFPVSFKKRVEKTGAKVFSVEKPTEIGKNIYSTGQMGTSMKEQSLVLRTSQGLVVVIGCAHPGVANIVKKAKQTWKDYVYLVFGGFHLMAYSERQVERLIAELKRLGVKKVGPSHCTGGKPIEMFKRAWRKNFIDLSCGTSATIP